MKKLTRLIFAIYLIFRSICISINDIEIDINFSFLSLILLMFLFEFMDYSDKVDKK